MSTALAQNRDPVPSFLWWSAIWALTMRGYGLAALLYFVVDADLEPLELVLLGTALEVSVLIAEIPTGVVADTLSRKRSIVMSHVIMGGAFVATGFTTDFWGLVVTQVLWGIGWTFTSGADIAWITDELDDPTRIDAVLTRREQWKLFGGVVGLGVSGLIAWTTSLATSMIVFGIMMGLTSIFVAVRFTEHNFAPVTEDRLREAVEIFKTGMRLSRHDPQIFLILGATLTLNSGAEAVDRLTTDRLVSLGFPEGDNPVVYLSVLAIVGALMGIVALRYIEQRVDEDGAPRRFYLMGVACAVVGAIVLAWAPNVGVGVAGAFIVGGLGWSIIPAVAAIWVNRRTPSGVRATVQSFVGQAESVGEITGGIALGVVAQSSGLSVALTGSAGLFLLTLAIVARSKAGRSGQSVPTA